MPSSVSSGFNELLKRLNLTSNQEDTANKRTAGIRTFLKSEFALKSQVQTVGSYARETICRPERDIDLLAPFEPWGDTDYWNTFEKDSSKFLYAVRDALNERYHATKVSSKRVAVVLEFNDITADVVPCFPRDGGGFLMPDGNGKWKATNPPFHTKWINDANAKKSHKLKPVVRLLKFWNLQNSGLLASFHLELMVAEMWTTVEIGRHASSVSATLSVLDGWITDRKDPWEPGGKITGYLSAVNRDKVKERIKSDAAIAKEAIDLDAAGKTEQAFAKWNQVFNTGFPAFG